MNIALIVFAGKGTRISSRVPKQFIKINDKEIVRYTIETFESHPLIDSIVLIAPKDYLAYTQNMVIKSRFMKVINIVEGGATRQESVRNGLNQLKCNASDNILIHDGDRPLLGDKLITQCLRELETSKALIPVIKSDSALKEVSNSGRKIEVSGISYDVQTPQCFKFGLIKDAHNQLQDKEVSDDATLVECLGEEVKLISGNPNNFKVTTDIDLDYLKKTLEK